MKREALLVFSFLLAGGCSGLIAEGNEPAPSASYVGTPEAATPAEVMPLTLPPPGTSTPTRTPVPSPSPTIACDAFPATMEATTYPAVAVPGEIPVRVFLPPCYGPRPERYPAVYLLHGYPYDETHWDDLGADEIAAEGMDKQGWPSFLVVMPRLPDPIFRSSDGGPGSYETEMIEALVPFIDGAYRTIPEPQARAIVGISRGGIWALEIGLRHPDIFGTMAALSPSLSSNYPRPLYDPFHIVASSAVFPDHIALYAGDREGDRRMIEKLSAALTEKGVDHSLQVVPGRHEDATWQALLPTLFEFLAAGWSSTP